MVNYKAIATWGFPLFFCSFWMSTRIHAYFLKDAEWNKEDFTNVVLRPDTPQFVKSSFFEVVDLYFDKSSIKYTTIRIHVATAVLAGFTCILQLLPFVRRASISFHRKLGYLYVFLLTILAVESTYTILLRKGGVSYLGLKVLIVDSASMVIMVVSTALGISYAKQHKVTQHKICMIINCAALFINPTHRFLWVIMSKSNFGAPYSSWPEWRGLTLGNAKLAAVVLNFSVAAACIMTLPPANKKTLKAA